ncbi:transposase, IS4 family [Trichormus variabilis ATCC 29413]|uniref:Transposase, IS4 family n=2 Tax=Anabaena variabilis TaxID=264691 RepID=Q3MFC9_TRIV2|nr:MULTISPECIES: IS1634-like element ISAva4 family transposase [Nostocaceae]ABA20307.1 transposase, IS4 family [Trichormus variabilis ATCC 29413]MBC1212716.1 IS1634-like element ISAva4 family transposase [Trichormus variabilis ARAD]MBC1257074.1 IS1634-like element ISAva4 family transposase [Trichormus variabilis V5]MBC1265817.1 IS1634-like element ISAva4 family transposase [Trichormus variabilis FSR]MBC1300628.1 IS1634-like element ISAva4 family transposase [Trichormus variabilis N2B]
MTPSVSEIRVQDIDHCGIVAGIIDQMCLVEQINQILGTHQQEIVSPGQAIKAMILNGLGLLSAPLYLFEKFFVGKATEHLLGEGIKAEHLNDDRLGRVLDKLYEAGLTQVFVTVALAAAEKFGVKHESLHLDSSSFHVHGEYANNSTANEASPGQIKIIKGYSRDHRPDLKQFIVDLMCSGDGDIPLYLRVADGNEADSAMFAQILKEFHQQWEIDALFVADAALYSQDNLKQMDSLRWISRVPATLTTAQMLMENISQEAFVDSAMTGYRIAECGCDYAGVKQRWLVVESEARTESDLKQLEKRLIKQLEQAQSQLRQLSQQEFACAADALQAAKCFETQQRFHQLAHLEVIEHKRHAKSGRPRKDAQPRQSHYQIRATVVANEVAIATEKQRAGRFILATNVLDTYQLSNDDLLQEYKAQQSTERGFRFLKDPLFFTSSVFLNSPQRVAALAMVMGLCLLVYSLGQRTLRQALAQAKQTINNQLGKPTASPTLRWVFQCFMSIHLVTLSGFEYIANLTDERRWILQFFGAPCRKYYLLT